MEIGGTSLKIILALAVPVAMFSAFRGGGSKRNREDRENEQLALLTEQVRMQQEQMRVQQEQMQLLQMQLNQTRQGVYVHVVIRGSRRRRGNRKAVYFYAGGEAYYTTPDKKDSIGYIGDDLHIKVAFPDRARSGVFINKLGLLNPGLGTNTIEPLVVRVHDEELKDTNTIFHWHYHASDETGSPPGSRDSATTEAVVTLGRDKRSRIVQFQRLEDMAVENLVGFEMAHILDKKFCNDAQKKDETNFLGLSPTLHKMFDGRKAGRAPTVVIDIYDHDEAPRSVPGIDGVDQLRYRVVLCVRFKNPSVAAMGRLAIMFKDTSETREEGMEVLVTVDVLDFAKFKQFIEWKRDDTIGKWAGGGSGDESDGGSGDSSEDEG